MPSFEKQSNGTWRVFVCKKGVRDSRTFDTKAEARDWANRREGEIAVGLKGTGRTLRQALMRYLDEEVPEHKGRRWEEVRIKKFCGLGKDKEAALPFIDKALADLSSDDLTTWKSAAKRARLSDATVRR